MRRRGSVLLCFVVVFAGLPQCTAQTTPTIRTTTQLAIVDVNVTDSHGNAIHGLKQSDFTLEESGAAQTISYFEEHSAPTAGELARTPQMPPLGANVYTNFTVAPENAPINILLIDYLNTPVENQTHLRQQLLSFVKSMKPGTPLAIFGLNTRLVLLQGFTSDPRVLEVALSSAKANQQNSRLIGDPLGTETLSDLTSKIATAMGNDPAAVDVVHGMQQMEATLSAQQARQRAVYTLDAMNQLARYLGGLSGRKNLIWFSGSFPISILPDTSLQDKQDPFLVANSSAGEFQATMGLLARSQVAVYPVDARGLFASTMMSATISGERNSRNPDARNQDLEKFTTQTFDEHATMRQMAEATGGHAFVNTNDLREAVTKAIEGGSNYYTLAYSPKNKKTDGKYRKINVRLASGGYALNYRKGYYADTSNSAPHAKPFSTAALASAPRPEQITRNDDPMRAAMERGAPDPTQIIFKAIMVASPTPSDKLAEGNTASPNSAPPYRLVTVAYAANPGDISMPQRPDGTRQVALDFVTLVYDRDGQLFTQQANQVNVFAKPEAYQEFMKEGMRYQQQIAVPVKGDYYVRAGIHDMIGDKVGAIEVPMAMIGVVAPASAAAPTK